MITLEEELRRNKEIAENIFDCLDELNKDIDDFINKTRLFQNFVFLRYSGEQLSSILTLVYEMKNIIDLINSNRIYNRRLLNFSNRKNTFDFSKLDTLNSKLFECEKNIFFLDIDDSDDNFNHIHKILTSNSKTIYKLAHDFIDKLKDFRFSEHRGFILKDEHIAIIWKNRIRRYEKENADIYEEYFRNVIDVQESLKLLREERNNNEYIASWQNIHVPAKYIAKLRAQEKATEQDLLPVFDYEIKYTKLKEMYKEQQQRSSSLQQQQHQTQHYDLQDIAKAVKENAGTHFSGNSQQNNFISTEVLKKILTSTQKTSQNLIE